MELTGLHLLLTYHCTLQCDHCFVFGGPWQEGTMSLDVIENILQQGKKLSTVKTIYFEGGEPFLYYPTLLRSVEMAYEMGFNVGLVSNGFWGISEEDAFRALSPMQGKVNMLSLSCDQYHWDKRYAFTLL
jgi:MoaA/NifB/PqqE/SkfB family radical SAM enzyme